jgi:D-alanyl-D-alanine dipeptidase
VRKEAADALKEVQEELKQHGLSLYFFDAYRPYNVTKKMWEIIPDERYAANPAKGSGHNRGASVDVTLADLKTGTPLEMPTHFDDFSEKAHHNYTNLPTQVIKNRELLRTVMVKYGFAPLQTEWWHYSIPGAAQKYELLDLSFRQMKRAVKQVQSNQND